MDLPNESVDLNGVDVIELLQSLLDLGLVGLGVDDEDQGVVLLNLLHGALSVERVNDDLVLVQARLVRERLAVVLRRSRQLQGLGTMEGRRGADLALLVRVVLNDISIANESNSIFIRLLTYALQCCLGCRIGLLQALRSLGGSPCTEKKASAIALNQNSQNLLCSMRRLERRARGQRQCSTDDHNIKINFDRYDEA